jgi:predicted DNA-binding transcriptional regulator YafY
VAKRDMMPNIMQVMSDAIRDRRCVAIRYHDQRQVRVIEPHAIYMSERGELLVDAYQTRGHSTSGRPPPFWRPFRLKKIAAVSVLREAFRPRVNEGFSPERLKYKQGLVAVVQEEQVPAFRYPSKPEEMGPFLPEGYRR